MVLIGTHAAFRHIECDGIRIRKNVLGDVRRRGCAMFSGTKLEDVNRLMKQFDQTRKMMRMVTGMGSSKMAQMANAMKAMKGGMPKF